MAAGETKRGLALEVSVPRDHFGIQDTLAVSCVLHNVGTGVVRVLHWMVLGPHLQFLLETPDGRIIRFFDWFRVLVRTSPEDYLPVLPGHLIGRVVDIPLTTVRAAWLGNREASDALGMSVPINGEPVAVWSVGLPPPESGSYALWAEFRLPGRKYCRRGRRVRVWSGRVRSRKTRVYIDFEGDPEGEQRSASPSE